ncbi:MAG TPA: hypothetical protein VKN74_03230 [Candidatus Mcinerneyibacterium sp.]|nr:hypothetical protein [Candidatus Mcinerneyibacterium sp.]
MLNKMILKSFGLVFFIFLFLNCIFGLENLSRVEFDYYYNSDQSNFYDGYFKNDFLYKDNYLEIKNRTFLGSTEENFYFLDSAYGEFYIKNLMVGAKGTYNSSDDVGSLDKYSFPLLKKDKNIFILDSLSYRDFFTVKDNAYELYEYIPINSIYGSFEFYNFKLSGETFNATPENLDEDENLKELEFFEDFNLSLVYEYGEVKNGLFYCSGSLGDYYYKKVEEDLNGNGNYFDDKYKDILIYALGIEDFHLNFGLYNYEQFHFITSRYKFKRDEDEYYIYLDSNFLNDTLSFYFTYNYDIQTYLHYSYKQEEKDYFLAMAKLFRIDPLKFNLMAGFRDIYDNNKNYRGGYYNLKITYPHKIADFYLSIGNTMFNNLWNSWYIYPENDNFVLHFGFSKNFKFNI